MSVKPILFSADMVRGLLDGRKTVTRRVVKPQPTDTGDCQHEMQTYDQMLPQFYKGDYSCVCRKCGYGTQPNGESIFHPPYRPGDILYVRETWCNVNTKEHPSYFYKADNNRPHDFDGLTPWRPSIHMPREAARIFLRVTDVRVERLHDITEEQARAEGTEPFMMTADVDKPDDEKRWQEMLPALSMFPALWDSTIKPADRALYGWGANPWVWVVGFERCEKPEGG